MTNIKKIYERTWRKAIFRPIEELKPSIPKVVYNPRLKRVIARAKMKLVPSKVEGGKIVSYPRVINPIIEVSSYFKKLPKREKEKVLEHEVMHIIHAQAFPGRRQLHREGSLLSMEKVILRWRKKK